MLSTTARILGSACLIMASPSVTLQTVPTGRQETWIPEVIAGAVLALLGYVGRALHENLKAKSEAKRNMTGELQNLSALLEESNALFKDQNFKARRLLKLLTIRFPDEGLSGRGFDEDFYRMHEHFNQGERELHSLIRSITMTSLLRVNTAMSDWLHRNAAIRQVAISDPGYQPLVEELYNLQLHLNLWHAKYAVHMSDPKRCLVYLADEKQHGIRFPQRLEPALAAVLGLRTATREEQSSASKDDIGLTRPPYGDPSKPDETPNSAGAGEDSL